MARKTKSAAAKPSTKREPTKGERALRVAKATAVVGGGVLTYGVIASLTTALFARAGEALIELV